MSFSSEAKAELCREKTDRKCCAVAESCGVLMYCNTFSPAEVRIVTASRDFASRLPRLFRRAFGIGFDVLPPEGKEGKVSFVIRDSQKIETIYSAFGLERNASPVHHVNFAILEEDCCRKAFVRGAFLAGGSVTDPEKRFHCEISTSHLHACRESSVIMQELGLNPKEATRKGDSLLYFKQADAIADFFTRIGAPVTGMNIINAQAEREMRNKITRRVNCDSANADKVVDAAQLQKSAIRQIMDKWGIDALPEPLREAALLRIANPYASLAELALLSSPKVTKSCLSHRLRKIAELSKLDELPESMLAASEEESWEE